MSACEKNTPQHSAKVADAASDLIRISYNILHKSIGPYWKTRQDADDLFGECSLACVAAYNNALDNYDPDTNAQPPSLKNTQTISYIYERARGAVIDYLRKTTHMNTGADHRMLPGIKLLENSKHQKLTYREKKQLLKDNGFPPQTITNILSHNNLPNTSLDEERIPSAFTLGIQRVAEPDKALEQQENRQNLNNALEKVSPQLSSIFLLQNASGLKPQTIQEILGHRNTAETYRELNKARVFLRAEIKLSCAYD